MSVYVDTLTVYPNAWGPFLRGSCHMFAKVADEDELHAMAARIGLRREWFQDKGRGTAHYDLTASKRIAAVKAGALEVDRLTAVTIWRVNRAIIAGRIERP